MSIPTISSLPSAPSRSSSPSTFATDADTFFNAFPTLVTEINAATAAIPNTVLGIDFTGTSSTSITIGTGSKTFTTQSGKNWYVGQAVRIASTSTPSNYMDGQVTSYSSTSLVVNVTAVGGAGTIASWTIGPGISAGTYASLNGTETLTNKTLTTPVLSASAAGTTAGQLGYSSGLLSYGNGSASLTLVSTTGTQTLTNKTLTSPTLTTATVSSGGITVTGNIVANNFVGIGTAAPSTAVHVYSGTSDGNIQIESTTGAAQFVSKRGANSAYIGYDASGGLTALGTNGAVDVVWSNNGYTERMRMLSTGGLLIGTSSTTNLTSGASANVGIFLDGLGTVGAQRNNNACAYFAKASGYSDSTFVQFQYNGGSVGTITTTGTATAYNTTSDERLKENIADADRDAAIAYVKAMRVRSFDWRGTGEHEPFGYIAQERLAAGARNVHVPTNPQDMLSLDYAKDVPALALTVQVLLDRVAALEAAK